MQEVHDSAMQSPVAQNIELAEKLSRETYVIGAGIIGGALQQAAKHPFETIGETTAMALAGTGLVAISTAEIPVISGLAIGTGVCLAGKYVWDLADPNSPHNIERNHAFGSAFNAAWSGTNIDSAINDLQAKAGRDSLLLFEGLIAGASAASFEARIPTDICNRNSMAFATEPGSIPTFRAYCDSETPDWINFQKSQHGRVTTRSLGQDEVARKARPELGDLKPESKTTEVKDSEGRIFAKDLETGELYEAKLSPPNGPDFIPPGTVRPLRFNKDHR